jgi:hypothetical protein
MGGHTSSTMSARTASLSEDKINSDFHLKKSITTGKTLNTLTPQARVDVKYGYLRA